MAAARAVAAVTGDDTPVRENAATLGNHGAMTESPNDELHDLDRQIEDTTRDIAALREQLASSGPLDSEERAAMLTNREELEGVLDGLQRRRDAVRDKLDQR